MTTADCHFSHPPGRPSPRPKASKPYSTTYVKSATSLVNNPTIGAWPTTNQEHISDRLKRFGGAASNEDVERIIPGGAEDKKVVVEVEDDERVLADAAAPIVATI
jgi:hypothetical protein